MSKNKKFRAKNQQQYQKLLKKAKKNPARYNKPNYDEIVRGKKKKPTVKAVTIKQNKLDIISNSINNFELTKKLAEYNQTASRPVPIPLSKKDIEELKNNKELKDSIIKHYLNALGNKAIKIEYGSKEEREAWKDRDVEQEVKEAILPFFGIEMKPQYLDDKKRYLGDRKQPEQLAEPKTKNTLADASKLLNKALLTSEDIEATNIVGFKYDNNYEVVQFETGKLTWVFTPISSKEYELTTINGEKVTIAGFEDQFNKMQLKYFDYFGSESLSRVAVTTNITFKEILANLVEYDKEDGMDTRRVVVVGREWQIFWGADGRAPFVEETTTKYEDKDVGVDYVKLDDDLVEDKNEDKRVKE